MKWRSEWRRVLENRSVKDKIGIARDCELCPVDDLPIVAELVREGVIVWIDRAVLPLAVISLLDDDRKPRIGVDCDIYQLTTMGIALCRAQGIKQK